MAVLSVASAVILSLDVFGEVASGEWGSGTVEAWTSMSGSGVAAEPDDRQMVSLLESRSSRDGRVLRRLDLSPSMQLTAAARATATATGEQKMSTVSRQGIARCPGGWGRRDWHYDAALTSLQ